MRDFLKANFGLCVLLTLFLVMLGAWLFIYFHAAPAGGDSIAWLQAKDGEVLAAIMTMIVGAVATNRRSSDSGNGTPPNQQRGSDHP
jgi:hypothetical protein